MPVSPPAHARDLPCRSDWLRRSSAVTRRRQVHFVAVDRPETSWRSASGYGGAGCRRKKSHSALEASSAVLGGSAGSRSADGPGLGTLPGHWCPAPSIVNNTKSRPSSQCAVVVRTLPDSCTCAGPQRPASPPKAQAPEASGSPGGTGGRNVRGRRTADAAAGPAQVERMRPRRQARARRSS